MRRWAWGGVGMLTFVWSLTRHWCYAEHGVGMLTFVWSWTRHWCDAEHGVGWGGDVNVRLKLNTPLMLRWAWVGWGCERLFEVEHATDATLSMGRSWSLHSILAMEMGKRVLSWPVEKNSTGLHAQWSLKLARQKKVRISCGRVANARKMTLKKKNTLRRLRNTERVVIFWQWWCAYTRDSAPGGTFMIFETWEVVIIPYGSYERDRKHVIQNAIGFNELKWQTELAQGLLPLGSWSSACDAGLTCGFTSRTSSIQSGSKHQRVEARCAQKWQIQFQCQPYAKLQLAIRLVPRLVPIPRIQTPGRWISASGSSRHGTQSSHIAPARNARCNVMCNVMCKVMCHVIATLMVIWLFKLRKPAGKLASCYSRTKWE